MKQKHMIWMLILFLVTGLFAGCATGSSDGYPTNTTNTPSESPVTGTNGEDAPSTPMDSSPEETSTSSAPPASEQPLVLQGPGFSPSNLRNEGMAAEYDGFIYHIDDMFEGNLWKTSVSSGESQLLQEGSLSDINANGGAVFAAGSVPPATADEALDRYGIFRIQADGSGLTMIKEGSFDNLMLQDEYLYYTDVINGGLYRMKYDGSDEKLLLEDIYDEVVIVNEAIYVVTDLEGSSDRHLYTLPLDGSSAPELLVKDLWGGFFADNQALYYESRGDSTEITYRYDTVSKSADVYMDKAVSYLNTDGDNLYYFWDGKRQDNEDQGFYQKNLATCEEIMIMKGDQMFDINVSGGKVFWHNNDDERRITVMNLDGTNQYFAEQKAD